MKKSENGERDKDTNRLKLYPHTLRKFFRSQMPTLIPVDVTEALMGHEGYLTEVYRRYDRGKLEEFYTEGEASVTIFGQEADIEKLREEVKERNDELQSQVKALRNRSDKLQREIIIMHEKLSRYENLEPLSKMFKQIGIMGGLPLDIFEKTLLRFMHEGLAEIEAEEMTEG